MRRRTHKLGGNKTIIYIIVVVLLVAGNYLYDNFAPEQAEAAEIEEVEFTESPAEAPAPKGKTAHAGWAELPSQKASNDIYVTSHLLGDNRRNYTVCYSREQRAPLWVAAPVHSTYKGDVMVVSQFTLHASTKKGNRPSYFRAAGEAISRPMYEKFVASVEQALGKKVATGEFGADMKVALVNDGPVTIWIDSRNKE